MDYHPSSVGDVRPFLQGPQRAVLSTVGTDGGPHQVVVDYAVDADGILLNGRVDRRWVRNLRRDPRLGPRPRSRRRQPLGPADRHRPAAARGRRGGRRGRHGDGPPLRGRPGAVPGAAPRQLAPGPPPGARAGRLKTAAAERVAVQRLALEQPGHGLQSDVRVRTDVEPVLLRDRRRAQMIHEAPRTDGPPCAERQGPADPQGPDLRLAVSGDLHAGPRTHRIGTAAEDAVGRCRRTAHPPRMPPRRPGSAPAPTPAAAPSAPARRSGRLRPVRCLRRWGR